MRVKTKRIGQLAMLAFVSVNLVGCNKSPSFGCDANITRETLEEVDLKRYQFAASMYHQMGIWEDTDKIEFRLEGVRTREKSEQRALCAAKIVYKVPIAEVREPANPALRPQVSRTAAEWQKVFEDVMVKNITYTVELHDNKEGITVTITSPDYNQ